MIASESSTPALARIGATALLLAASAASAQVPDVATSEPEAATAPIEADSAASADGGAVKPADVEDFWTTADGAFAQPPADSPPAELAALDVTGNTVLSALEVERAIYPSLGPDRTTDDVRRARSALLAAYRARGFNSVAVLATAEPITAGVYRLQVLENRVGRIRVTGARYSSPRRIREQVGAVREGEVVNTRAAEAQLAEVNRTPDRVVQAPTIEVGQVPGTLDYTFEVEDTLPLHANVELNDDASPNTTPLRLSATLRYTNLWQLGHTISGTYFVSPQDRTETEVFAGSYLAPLWNTPWSVLVYGYVSNSDVAALGGTNVLGDGETLGVRGIYQLPVGQGYSHSFNFGVDYKFSNENILISTTDGDGETTVTSAGETPITYYPLTAIYSYSRFGEKAQFTGSIGATLGLRGLGSSEADFGGGVAPGQSSQGKRAFASGEFVHFNIDAEYTRTPLFGPIDASIKLSGQFADGPLVSPEQFAIGGRQTIRGYKQSEGVGDEGAQGSLELRSPSLVPTSLTFVTDLTVFAFGEIGYVNSRRVLPGQDAHFTIASAGLGTRVQLLKYLYGDFELGLPLIAGPETDTGELFTTFSVRAAF